MNAQLYVHNFLGDNNKVNCTTFFHLLKIALRFLVWREKNE